MVPKLTGNHEDFAEDDRTSGEYASEIRHWSLDVSNLLIYAEREAETNAGARFWSEAETGWVYPNTAHGEVMVYEAALYHSDWGREETCDLDLQVRRDQKGLTQTASKRGVELSGARISHFWISRSGQSMKAVFKHEGRTEAYGSAKRRALGPLVLDLESMGDIGKV